MTDTKEDRLQDVGKNALASLREMVAALECDYDRLEDLRSQLSNLAEHSNEAQERFNNAETPSEKAEAREEFYEAEEMIKLWRTENAEELESLSADSECESREDAEQRIQEDALSVRIFGERIDGEWEADRFEILLTTGGPAVRIMGELDGTLSKEPSRAWLEVQDWGTPWTQYFEQGVGDICLTYARCFCFD